MNTTYYDSDGQEIFNKRKIRLNYLFGMFFIDLVSSLPIEIILPGSYLRMFNILKIIRVFRLTTIINKMNAEEESKSVSLFYFLVRNFMILFFYCLFRCSECAFWCSNWSYACTLWVASGTLLSSRMSTGSHPLTSFMRGSTQESIGFTASRISTSTFAPFTTQFCSWEVTKWGREPTLRSFSAPAS